MSEIFSEIFSGIGSGGGGSPLLFWDPLATQGEFGYQNIEAGVKKAGTYNIINNPTQATIDGVPQNTSIGTTIAFIDNGSGWSIVSQTSQQAKYTSPSSVADETVLNATFPIPEDYEGQYCYVQSTNTYWTVKLEVLNWIWYDTGEVSVETYSKTEQDAFFQANSTTDRNRANHTGTQLASTISDFDAEVENNTEVLANTTARHSHTNKAILDGTQESFTTALKTNYDTSYTHIASTTNPHSVTKAQVGLGNVDNTSDIDKPISTATQTALDTKVDKIVGKQLSTEDFTTVEKNKLAGIQEGAEVNIQADWEQADNLQDSFIQNKPTLGTVASKDVGTAVGNIQENGAILGNSQIVETDATGKFITTSKNTAYNKNFGTLNGEVAQGDASYLKADTYTKTEIDNSLNLKQNTSEKGQANGYASLDGTGKVPASQLPSFVDDVLEYADVASFPVTGETGKVYVALDTNLTYRWSGSVYVKLNDVDLTNYFNKVTDTTDNITEGTAKFTTQADIDKLAGIEANATADQTAAEIKIAYESNADTNAFTDAEKTNLSNQSGTNTGDETTSSIQTKRPLKTIEGQSLEGSGNIDLTKSDVDLGNVDNTSDVDKPVSTAQQLALDGKLAKDSNLIDVANTQTALNNLTNVDFATNEYVLTKDTATGNALWKAAAGGGAAAIVSIGNIGEIIASYSEVPPTGFLRANGQTVAKTSYPQLWTWLEENVSRYTTNIAETGKFYVTTNDIRLPNFQDVEGRFIRSTNGTRVAGDLQGYSTAMPINPFVTNTTGAHTHDIQATDSITGDNQNRLSDGSGGNLFNYTNMTEAGDHFHTITAGGDSETRPNSITLYHYIRVAKETASTNDLYTTGTFTPELLFVNATYNSVSGSYIKIGDLVRLEYFIDASSIDIADTSNVHFGGFPFAVANKGYATINIDYFASTAFNFTANMSFNSTGDGSGGFYIWLSQPDGTRLSYNSGFINASGIIKMTIEYRTA